MWTKVKETVEESGVSGLVRKAGPYVYERLIRRHLPCRARRYGGIEVPAARAGDRWIPWIDDEPRPHYEAPAVDALRSHVRSGDDVVVVGGGWGVTATVAAMQAGSDGSVRVYEAGDDAVRNVRATTEWNAVSDRVEVHHAGVGPVETVRGSHGEARSMSPEELPVCDVLEMDCEGAECAILEAMTVAPRTIVVESHGSLGCPEKQVQDLLAERGYRVDSRAVADPTKPEVNEEIGNIVLVAHREEGERS